jgi:hypothetical protein
MAEKTSLEFSAPSIENIRTGPKLPTNHLEFELKPSLINMVQATTFSGKAQEDANAHLQDFLEIGSTIIIKKTKISYSFIYFHSHWREERSSGSTPTKTTWTLGTTVRRPFY